MNNLSIIILAPKKTYNRICQIAKNISLNLNTKHVTDLDMLNNELVNEYDIFISFGTSVIIPIFLLKKIRMYSVNVHAGSFNYPGRDPHHFAVYFNEKIYGATLHKITDKVDDGEIIDVENYPVKANYLPIDLLRKSNLAGFKLIKRFFYNLKNNKNIKLVNNISWGKTKNTRKKFIDLCSINVDITSQEFERKLKATSFKNFKNLYIDIHGYRFRIDKKIDE